MNIKNIGPIIPCLEKVSIYELSPIVNGRPSNLVIEDSSSTSSEKPKNIDSGYL